MDHSAGMTARAEQVITIERVRDLCAAAALACWEKGGEDTVILSVGKALSITDALRDHQRGQPAPGTEPRRGGRGEVKRPGCYPRAPSRASTTRGGSSSTSATPLLHVLPQRGLHF